MGKGVLALCTRDPGMGSCYAKVHLFLHDVACCFFQLEGQIIAVLVQNLDRLDENNKEESDGVHNTLSKLYTVNLEKKI